MTKQFLGSGFLLKCSELPCDAVGTIIAELCHKRQILIRRAKLHFEFWSWGGKGEGFNVWAATAPFNIFIQPKCWLQFLLQGDDLRTECSDCLKTILSDWPCLLCSMKMVFFWYRIQVQINHSYGCVHVWDCPRLNWGISTFKSAAPYMAKRGSEPM